MRVRDARVTSLYHGYKAARDERYSTRFLRPRVCVADDPRRTLRLRPLARLVPYILFSAFFFDNNDIRCLVDIPVFTRFIILQKIR